MSRVRDLLLLTRAPLAVTAVADGLTGALLARPDGAALRPEALLLVGLASATAYAAGMALNDIFDRERDGALAPTRPLPSGRISLQAAWTLALGLLAGALGGAAALGVPALLWALALIAAIFAYDALLKRWELPGCAAMASCRALNILMGGAAFAAASPAPATLAFALASFGYIFALTWLSTKEDEEASALVILAAGALLLAAPAAMLALLEAPWPAWGLGCALMALVALRLGLAWRRGTRATGHGTTRWLIRGTLLLSASALLARGEGLAASLVLASYLPYSMGASWLFRPR